MDQRGPGSFPDPCKRWREPSSLSRRPGPGYGGPPTARRSRGHSPIAKNLARPSVTPLDDRAGDAPRTPSPARPALLALAVFALAFGIGLRQLARSNRPHELTAAPLVAALFAVSLGGSVVALRRLGRRDRDDDPWTIRRGLLTASLLALAAVGLYGFVVATDTAVQVLRAE